MDSVNIVRLLKTQYAESAARLLAPFDEQRVLQYVTATLGNKYAFSIVVEASGRLLGTAALAPVPLPWCTAVVMAEAWFAVVPAYREKEAPGQLLLALGAMLDREGIAAIHGTNLLAPEEFDELLAARKDLTIGRTTYVRVPKQAKAEVA
jgi:N-acetylglutamate synthase-like GNAT family acetyltransferase